MEWVRSCFASTWKLFRNSDVETPGYYWVPPAGTPFYPGVHQLWSRDWVSDELGDGPHLGEQAGRRTWFSGRKTAAAVPPAVLVGSADCVAAGDSYPPPAGLVYLDGSDSRCWTQGTAPPEGAVNVIETVKVCDDSASASLVQTLCFDPMSQFTLTPGSGGQATVGLHKSGTGPLLGQSLPVADGMIVAQPVNGGEALTIIRFTDTTPTGLLLRLCRADMTAPVFAVDAAGALTAGTVPAANVTGLAASATTDATNASNLSSGTVPVGRLPPGGYGSGVTAYSGTNPLAAAGTTQAGATLIATDTAHCTTTAGNTGVRLPASPGFARVLVTADSANGANTLLVYPPSGGKFMALATNAPLTVVNGNAVLLASDKADNSLWRLLVNIGT